MKTEIENIIYNCADEIPHILIRVINAITLSDNEKELRTAIGKIAEETELDKFFAYGYGAHHFCGCREQGGSTAESPAKLWVGYGWKHSQHLTR